MQSLKDFSTQVYSEEICPVTETEFDEVMSLMATNDFAGYSDWSEQIESPSIDNYEVRAGRVFHKPEPKSNGRIEGFEI